MRRSPTNAGFFLRERGRRLQQQQAAVIIGWRVLAFGNVDPDAVDVAVKAYYKTNLKTYGFLENTDYRMVTSREIPRIYTRSATSLHRGFHAPTPALPRAFTTLPPTYTRFPWTYTRFPQTYTYGQHPEKPGNFHGTTPGSPSQPAFGAVFSTELHRLLTVTPGNFHGTTPSPQSLGSSPTVPLGINPTVP